LFITGRWLTAYFSFLAGLALAGLVATKRSVAPFKACPAAAVIARPKYFILEKKDFYERVP
jgi:hypothetical protein